MGAALNSSSKSRRLDSYNLLIVERVPLLTRPTRDNIGYLRTKQLKLGHTPDLGMGAAAKLGCRARGIDALRFGPITYR